MRIAMVAPIWEPIPPKAYGGIERVIHALTQQLVARGHHVTLFTTGDSESSAPCLWTEPRALRQMGYDTWHSHLREAIHLANAYRRHDAFDLFHNHCGPLGIAFAQAAGVRALTTLHAPLLPETQPHYMAFPEHPVVSISQSQREGCPQLNYLATVYNGIDTRSYQLAPKQDYLLFLGRITPEKGPHLAIEVAKRSGVPLVMAAKVDPADQAFFESQIVPHLDGDRIRYVGEVGGRNKRELLAGALGLLHLVQWPEPFGLVMAEALAAGTPVIAMPLGSVPELITHGKTGFVVGTLDEAVRAVEALPTLDPEVCRAEAVARFDVERMVDGYLAAYASLAQAGREVRG